MKTSFPDYSGIGVKHIRESLDKNDRTILEKFVKHCRITSSDKAIEDIERRMLQSRDIIEKPFNSWNKEDVENFTGLLNNSSRTQWTKHGALATFKRFLKWQYKDLGMLENVRLRRVPKFNYQRINDSSLLTADEVERLIRAADTLRMKAFIMVLYETGARPQEIRNLRWRDIRFNDDHADLNIFAPKTKQGRTIPVKEAVVHLKRWKQEYCLPEARPDYLIFPGKIEKKNALGETNRFYDPNKIMSQTVLSKTLRSLGKKAQIGRTVYPYLIRHSRLTALYSQLPEQIVKKFAGHAADSDMPAVYSHISNKDVKDAMLEQIYNVKELSPEQKNKYDLALLELEEMKRKMAIFQEAFELLGENTIMIDETSGKKVVTLHPSPSIKENKGLTP